MQLQNQMKEWKGRLSGEQKHMRSAEEVKKGHIEETVSRKERKCK